MPPDQQEPSTPSTGSVVKTWIVGSLTRPSDKRSARLGSVMTSLVAVSRSGWAISNGVRRGLSRATIPRELEIRDGPKRGTRVDSVGEFPPRHLERRPLRPGPRPFGRCVDRTQPRKWWSRRIEWQAGDLGSAVPFDKRCSFPGLSSINAATMSHGPPRVAAVVRGDAVGILLRNQPEFLPRFGPRHFQARRDCSLLNPRISRWPMAISRHELVITEPSLADLLSDGLRQ